MYASKTNRGTETISADALARLMEYSWPGNVRELQNVIERSVLMTSDAVLRDVSFMSAAAPPVRESHSEEISRVKTIAEMEKDHILAVLRKCKGRISGSGGAAELLRLPASTLKSKMKKLGIEKIYKE